MAKIILKNVCKQYEGNDKFSVNNFNLEINDNEFIVFVGPSGCGKSTTLRMIAGLEDITSGEIYIDEMLANNVEPKDRDIAMVFQNYALYPSMTVYENMAFGLRLKKIVDYKKKKDGTFKLDKNGNKISYKRHYTNAEIDAKVIEAANILDIKEYLERKPKALSGGQKQRVAIGRAIVRKPKVFLMDEPLSNLDAKLRNQMRSELILLREKVKTNFIYVTHDQIEAMTLGDRIVVMKDGIIQQVGTPAEVFQHPSNLFVAGFIGTPQMNFIDAHLYLEEEQYYLSIVDRKIKLNEKINNKLKENNVIEKDVVLGIRPDFIKLNALSKDAFEATVIVSEMMGAEYYLHLDFNGNKLTIKSPLSDVQSLIDSKQLTKVKFVLDMDNINIFDKETEINLVK